MMVARGVHPFLAITEPVGAQVLIVEGWIPERAYVEVADVYRHGGYAHLLVVVGVYDGDDLYDGSFYDDYLRSVVVKQGVPAESVRVVIAPVTRRDRTHHGARVARRFLVDSGQSLESVDVATLGAHARRTRLLYQQAFGDQTEVGIVALAEQTYDTQHWWRYSAGIRDVFSETLGYGYARFFFRPPDPPEDDAPFEIPERRNQGRLDPRA